MIKVADLYKSYNGEPCLRGASLSVSEGEFVSLMGESGSGKTTLLEILVGLREPDSGSVFVASEDVLSMNARALSDFRKTKVGVVYQSFGLIPTLTARENIRLPLMLRREGGRDAEEKIESIAERLGIFHCLDKAPRELSGGQAQRVAIARAVVYKPRLLLLDEPTGALDAENTDRVLKFFSEFREDGGTVLQITHSEKAAAAGTRILRIRDGVVFE